MEKEAVNPLNRCYNIAIVGFLLIFFMGCGTTAPSRLYTLTSLTNRGVETPALRDVFRLSVAVGPVQLPKYLQRPQIVTRLGPNKIEAADFDRWAGPLEDNVFNVLVENLTYLLWDEHITVSPWIGSRGANYRISVDITRFDGQLGGDVFLIAGWTIVGKEKNTILLERRSVIKEASGQPNYAAMVSAKSRALANLSRDIAENISALCMHKHGDDK